MSEVNVSRGHAHRSGPPSIIVQQDNQNVLPQHASQRSIQSQQLTQQLQQQNQNPQQQPQQQQPQNSQIAVSQVQQQPQQQQVQERRPSNQNSQINVNQNQANQQQQQSNLIASTLASNQNLLTQQQQIRPQSSPQTQIVNSQNIPAPVQQQQQQTSSSVTNPQQSASFQNPNLQYQQQQQAPQISSQQQQNQQAQQYPLQQQQQQSGTQQLIQQGPFYPIQQPQYAGTGTIYELKKENDIIKKQLQDKDKEILRQDSQIYQSNLHLKNVQDRHAKEVEDLKIKLSSIQSDTSNFKVMKYGLEDEIENIKRQRADQLESHTKEMRALRERQAALIQDLQEEKKKYDHLHFFAERNTKQFAFEEEQLRSQLKMKDQEISNLEKNIRLGSTLPAKDNDQQTNLLQENENLRQRMSDMAKQLSQYSDVEKRLNDNVKLKLDTEAKALENKYKIEAEKTIRLRTNEIDNEMIQLNQNIVFLKQREANLLQENEQMKQQLKKMSDSVYESIDEIRLWKEKYAVVSSNASQGIELDRLAKEAQNKIEVIKEQEQTIYQLNSELQSYKKECDRLSNKPQIPSVNYSDNDKVSQLQRQTLQQQSVIQDLSNQLEDVKKRSHPQQQQQQQVNIPQVAELQEQNQLLSAKHKQLTTQIVNLEGRLARYEDRSGQPLNSYNVAPQQSHMNIYSSQEPQQLQQYSQSGRSTYQQNYDPSHQNNYRQH